jgi:Mitochondrial carrier protein
MSNGSSMNKNNDTGPVLAPGAVLLAPSPASGVKYDFMYYLKGAAAGGICCSITHGALTPVDVVKTRVQLDSAKVRTVLICSRLSTGE